MQKLVMSTMCLAFGVMALAVCAETTITTTTTTTTVTTTEKDKETFDIVAPPSLVVVAPEPVVEKKDEDLPPPPEPSAEDAKEPRKLIRYFCRMWKEEEYEAMYWAMTSKFRKSMTLKKFTALFEDDAEITGGLKDENMVLRDDDEGKTYIVVVDLMFNNVRMKTRRVKAVLEKTKGGYRIKSGLVPIDMSDL